MSAAPHIVHLDLERGWRGGERQVQLLVAGLAAAGLRQTVVARAGEPLAERVRSIGGVAVVPVAGRVSAWRQLPRAAPDVVFHAHTGNTIPLAVWAARRGAHAVVTRRLDLPPRRWPLGRADRVVAISSAVARALTAAGIAAERIAIIPSAVDLTRRIETSSGGASRAAIGVPADAVCGLTVAALVGQKDPLTLVRALGLLPPRYHHVWVGDGPLRPEVQALAERLGVASRLHLVGFTGDPDRWFAAADVFVLPSVHEGLGTVLLDAFHFGVPVVATAIPGTSDLLQDGETAFLFAPGDAAGLAAAIDRWLKSPQAAARIVAHAKRAVGAFGVANMVAAYVRLYTALAAD